VKSPANLSFLFFAEKLHRAMASYTEWLNGQIANVSQNVNNCKRKG